MRTSGGARPSRHPRFAYHTLYGAEVAGWQRVKERGFDGYERKIDSFYAGKVWRGYAFEVHGLGRPGGDAGFHVAGREQACAHVFDIEFRGVNLLLFSHVFAKRQQAVCGKPGVFGEDGRAARVVCQADERVKAA